MEEIKSFMDRAFDMMNSLETTVEWLKTDATSNLYFFIWLKEEYLQRSAGNVPNAILLDNDFQQEHRNS